MIEAAFFYSYLSIIVLVAVLVSFIFIAEAFSKIYHPKLDLSLLVFCLGLLIVLMGTRDFTTGTDTIRYVRDFQKLQELNAFDFEFIVARSTVGRDPIFVVFSYLVGRAFSASSYIFILAFLFYFLFYSFIKRITDKYFLLHLLVFLCFLFFLSLAVNILRTGLSVMLVLYGLSFLFNNARFMSFKDINKGNAFLALLFIFLGVAFHAASIILVASVVIVACFRGGISVYILGLLASLVLAYLGYSLENLPLIGQYLAASGRTDLYYSDNATQPPSGVNTYVVVFTMLILSYYMLQPREIKMSATYSTVAKIYLVLAMFYSFCLNIAYSDRFGIYSWIFIPLLLIYPVVVRRKLYSKQGFYMALFGVMYFLLMLYRISVY